MELHGMIKTIGEKEQITENFSKMEVLLDTSTYEQGTGKKFENYAKVQFCNAHTEKLTTFKVGDRVKIEFGIYGKEAQTRDGKTFFSQNLNAYKIEKI